MNLGTHDTYEMYMYKTYFPWGRGVSELCPFYEFLINPCVRSLLQLLCWQTWNVLHLLFESLFTLSYLSYCPWLSKTWFKTCPINVMLYVTLKVLYLHLWKFLCMLIIWMSDSRLNRVMTMTGEILPFLCPSSVLGYSSPMW